MLFKYGAYRTCAVALARSRIDREKVPRVAVVSKRRHLPVRFYTGNAGTPGTGFVGRGFGRRADVRAVRWWVWMVATCEVRLRCVARVSLSAPVCHRIGVMPCVSRVCPAPGSPRSQITGL